ncbi:hybrid sensor histidine kinase/response regulator [Burkholderia vietnamiensis]|jgi:signal transduction histidine kinase|uniref:hybrid sensor histidine kinase/response regulator n=1 Tax=Burkholderia vietnamiensis TaxID=60552 RepID=UPI0007543D47|nr:hybrid sensor histidine kinase/response regulator [Burkholderia vietnamiensis]TPQ38313.1 hybrid sensor histidine kinase/response regulator [Burkholderia ubonensis]KVE58142.1 hybrid sensor histidine kinase/response regulator [Burkholderia vietnamiensis]KVE74886.1 hybrid sensor histidine kinase/response regulator [Burkholderia vietnamiensis]KVE81825.1 hybrid sensor histidine kinase/response regulator [Burkholderia vietnamiensis]KVE92986.1 hybrid sensor histidine kinase/response regulator [Bur
MREHNMDAPVVLVVDDTAANLGLVVDTLEAEGMRVAVARDGHEALRRAELVKPDLILLDVMMPGLDGFQTCRALKDNPVTRDIPVIFMTSLTQTEDKITGFRVGAMDFVTKPLQMEEVAVRVQTHLKLHALQRLQQEQNARLEEEVRTRIQAQDALIEVLNGVRNVSNAIAHDLRTPLTELRSRLEVLLLGLRKKGDEDTLGQLEVAMTDVDRVIGIFNALLRLAEIDAGVRRSGFVKSDVVTILSDAVEFYQPVAELRGISLTLLLCSETEVLAEVDPLLLAQAIGNLIDNALKYAQDNGEVEVSLCERDDRIEVTVSDDGPGIPFAERSKVTERFYRGDRSRGTPGVGLGLALVKAVATLHHGFLEFADNEPGLAATMTILRFS